MREDQVEYFHFTGPARVDKAMHTLEGLLKGIASDGVITVEEVGAVKRWVSEHAEFAHRHPFNDIIPLLKEALADGVFDQEEMRDAVWLCSRLNTDSQYYDLISSDMQRLQGMLGGIIADGKVTMAELEALSDWMQDHEHLRSCWPYDEIDSLLMTVRQDGTIDEGEHRLLMSFFSEFTTIRGNRAVDLPLNEVNVPITGVCAACPEVRFNDKLFCFTGASQKVSRKEFALLVESLGGHFSKTVRKDLNYLVIGGEGNPCWAYCCYGRKVENAIELRKRGAPLLLVHEFDFWDAVEGQKSRSR